MDVKVTLNTRRVVVLSSAFIMFGLSVFFIGMLVGAKARPSEAPVVQAKNNLADKQKISGLEKPAVDGAAASLAPLVDDKLVGSELDAKNEALSKLAVPEVDVKKEVDAKLKVPEVDAKKEVLDKLSIPEGDMKKEVDAKLKVPDVDVKNEVVALVPPVLKDKPVAEVKASPAPGAEKDKLPAKPGAGKDKPAEKKADQSKKDVAVANADELAKSQKSSGSYTVQIGAFLDKANAEVALQDLREKGYSPYIHTIWDDMRRQWHTVRLGNYEDQVEASKFAADFTKKERIPTSVRGIGVL